MMAEAVVAPIEPVVEPAVSVTADLHVPPLASLPAGHVAGGPQVLAQQTGGVPRPPYSFKQFADGLGLSSFTAALEAADLLTNYVDSCETALTIFAPSDDAFKQLGALPEDMQPVPGGKKQLESGHSSQSKRISPESIGRRLIEVLRELLCVHITLGSLSHAELLNTRSITTISQQTHHVVLADDGGPPRVLQVGSASLLQTDIQLPDGRGVIHVIDSVMCCIRLLQHCRYEQVWNKTVRPSPKVGLAGEWRPRQDELHAILIHCDSWQPRFQGLRGSVIPLGGTGADRSHKSFHDGVVHFSELLILEKPPEMSKKKRKKKDTDDAATPTPLLLTGPAGAPAVADNSDGQQSSNYRIMFSLYRRFTPADGTPAAASTALTAAPDSTAVAVAGAPVVSPPGKHLTFCMAPEDILIRNSFHMLSETEKNARRAEYKASSDGSSRSKPGGGGGGRGRGGGANSSAAAAAVTATATVASAMPGGPLPVVTAMYEPGMGAPALPIAQASSAGGPMGLAMVTSRPMPPPELNALSLSSGPHCGGTPVWVRGRHFCGATQLYIGGVLAPQLALVSEGLATFVTPPAAPAEGSTPDMPLDLVVEVMATNSDLFGGGQPPTLSNALQFTYTASAPVVTAPPPIPTTDSAADAQAMERALALLAAHAAPRVASGAENVFVAANLPRTERALFAALSLVLSPRQGGVKPDNAEAVPVDLKDALGRTLLHYSSALKHRPAIDLLLRSGADPTARDAHGVSPIDLARAAGMTDADTLFMAANGNGMPPLTYPVAGSMLDTAHQVAPMTQVAAAVVSAQPAAPEVGALLTLGSAAPGAA